MLVLVQDNAPSHAGKKAREELQKRGVTLIFWPPFSPDLNPIESKWNWMMDWIEVMYSFDKVFTSYDELRRVTKEAWEAMRQRCQHVMDAQGGYTKW